MPDLIDDFFDDEETTTTAPETETSVGDKKATFAQLKAYDAAYYTDGIDPLVTDDVYDRLRTEAKTLWPNNPYFDEVGIKIDGADFVHDYVMGSLTKYWADEDRTDYIGHWLKGRTGKVVVMPKLDGLSNFSEYSDGRIKRCGTRGDGAVGTNIIEKAKIFSPVIMPKDTIEMRGEMVLTGNSHTELGYANRRNGASGIIGDTKPGWEDKAKHIDVMFFELIKYEGADLSKMTESQRLELLKELVGNKCVPFVVTDIETLNGKKLEKILERFIDKLKPYCDIDGLVLSMDESIREDVAKPTEKVAFKKNAPAKTATVSHIDLNTTRTGRIMPRLFLTDKVELAGAMVDKATAHNMKYIIDNGLGPGAEIGIVRSGEVIPYVTEVKKKSPTPFDVNGFKCPACGAATAWSDTGADLMCTNRNCSSREIYMVEHFLRVLGAEEITATTIEKTECRDLFDVYDKLTYSELIKLDGFQKSKASNIEAQVRSTLVDVNPAALIAAFGISKLGVRNADKIVDFFRAKSKDNDGDTIVRLFLTCDPSDFLMIDGFGRALVKAIADTRKHCKLVYRLVKKEGIEFKEFAGGPLEGHVIVVTGTAPGGLKRPQIEKYIELRGAKAGKGVTGKTTILACQSVDGTSGKIKKAKQLNTKPNRKHDIKIMDYNELYTLLGIEV